jgi:hypothetical protein
VTSDSLENLARIGSLKREPPAQAEVDGLAALRRRGYRSENRYLVFQALPHTLGLEDAEWRVLATCHERRNKFEYEGVLNVDERLLAESIAVTERLLAALQKLGPVGSR